MATSAPKKPRQLPLRFDYGKLGVGQQSYIKASYHSKKRIDNGWRGMLAVPPNTLFERVLSEFEANTNIPLEIPFTTLLHYIGGYLCAKDVNLVVHDQRVKSDFWTVVLADSSAGKTWTKTQIGKALAGNVPEVSGSFASAAKFVEELQSTPRGLMVRDEWLQLLKQIEVPNGPLSEAKDYLLRIYDNASIERKTLQYSFHIPEPALCILAFNALQPFIENMDPESLVDGFAQRFAYCVARKDPKRPFTDYAIWSVESSPWKAEWENLVRGIQHEYQATKGAERAFVNTFSSMVRVDLDESFYRRVLWRAHKYALVYHIVRGQAADQFVTEEDYAWAARLITLQLADASDVIDMCSGSPLGKLIDQAERAAEKLIAAGTPVTPRTLLQRVKGLANAGTARFVFEMLDSKYRTGSI